MNHIKTECKYIFQLEEGGKQNLSMANIRIYYLTSRQKFN